LRKGEGNLKREVKKATDKMTISELYSFNKDCVKTMRDYEREKNRIEKRQNEIKEIIDYIPDRIEILAGNE
jgi:hypothetical protein